MPNVDDHGLEVLKKAARNLDPTPKRDYALQVIVVKDESVGGGVYSPEVLNISIPIKDTEVEVVLPEDFKAYILKSRKVSRLKIAFIEGGTNDDWFTIPLGGYWTETRKTQNNKLYVQSNKDDTILEVVVYK